MWRRAESSASLLQSSVSHDPSEIILICWFIISVETVVLLHIFLEPVILFSLNIWWIKSYKEQHLLKMELFYDIIFTITFYLFNTSLLNKIINLLIFFNSSVYCSTKFIFRKNTPLFNFLFIKQSWKKYHRSQTSEAAQLFPTLIINQHINMISVWHWRLE